MRRDEWATSRGSHRRTGRQPASGEATGRVAVHGRGTGSVVGVLLVALLLVVGVVGVERRKKRGEHRDGGRERKRGWRGGTRTRMERRGWRGEAGMERRNKDEDADAGEVAGPAGTGGTRRKKRGGGNRRDDAEAGEDAKEGGSASSAAAMESRRLAGPDLAGSRGRWRRRCGSRGVGRGE